MDKNTNATKLRAEMKRESEITNLSSNFPQIDSVSNSTSNFKINSDFKQTSDKSFRSVKRINKKIKKIYNTAEMHLTPHQ